MGVKPSLTLRKEDRGKVSDGRVLRIFEPKTEEVAGGWRKLHEALHNLYAPPNIIRMIKPRRMGWTGHVASMGEI
jgi:hypothetical protein